MQKNRWNWGISEGINGIRRIQATNYILSGYSLAECAVVKQPFVYPVYDSMLSSHFVYTNTYSVCIEITTCLSFFCFLLSFYNKPELTITNQHTWWHGVPEYSLKSEWEILLLLSCEGFTHILHISENSNHRSICVCVCDCACEIMCNNNFDACIMFMMAAMMVIMMRKSYHVVLFTPNLNISISFGCMRKWIWIEAPGKHKRWAKKTNDFGWYGEWPINNHVWDKQRASQRSH